MRLLTYVLTVLVVFVAETAGSTITADKEANDAARSTLPALSRTNRTLPVVLRTGTSHDDAAVETDDEGQHDGEERTGMMPQTFEEVPAMIHHFATFYEKENAVASLASHMSNSEVVAKREITNDKAFLKKLGVSKTKKTKKEIKKEIKREMKKEMKKKMKKEMRKNMKKMIEEMKVKTKKTEGQPWNPRSVAESLISTTSNEKERRVQVELAVKKLLKRRSNPDMTRYADDVHRELVDMYGRQYGESLVKVYLKAKVTPNQFVDMMWGSRELYVTGEGFNEEKIKVFEKAMMFMAEYYLPVHKKDLLGDVLDYVRAKLDILLPPKATGKRDILNHESTT
ncbi:unnamed protein product [Hyaloperonospora brassicae]|uniref:RxLR effector candidate protein n=1 Tax=Hyaloperonospora brassicae TaxID=162125 RepID=A0AAV0TB20_HYABA|nr:unnamed protein product [Hyaloperonospora brassicae]